MEISLESLESISLKVKNTRKSLGLSQKALAKFSEMSQSTIARIETDVISLNPSYRTIVKVVDALNNFSAMHVQEGLPNKTAFELMHRKIVFVKPGNTVEEAIGLIKNHDFSQLPVLNENHVVIGAVYQKRLIALATERPNEIRRLKVREVIDVAMPQVDKNTPLSKLKPILENWDSVLVVDNSKVVGIITIYDLFKLL